MKTFAIALIVLGSVLASAAPADAHGFGFRRRGSVVVNAPGAQVVVGRRGFGRQRVVVNSGFGFGRFGRSAVVVRQPFLLSPSVVYGGGAFIAPQAVVVPSTGCSAFFAY